MSQLFVIAGHGAGDPGAMGNGYSEAERVRVLANKIKELGGDNVILGDTSRNWYADKGISTLNIPEGCKIIELHMDCSTNTSAKGAHVIIKKGQVADGYDNALANFVSNLFPGRAEIIVGHSELANVNRAAARGFNYRLVEFGFISNAGDVEIFNSNIENIAIGILGSFNIPVINRSAEVVLLDHSHYGDESRWYIEYVEDSYIRLKNKKTGLYLDVTGGNGNNGTFIQAHEDNNSDAQKFKFVHKSYGEADYILLEPKVAKGKYLSVENNGKDGSGNNHLKLWDDLHNSQQKFWMKNADDGTFMLMHTYSIMYVGVK